MTRSDGASFGPVFDVIPAAENANSCIPGQLALEALEALDLLARLKPDAPAADVCSGTTLHVQVILIHAPERYRAGTYQASRHLGLQRMQKRALSNAKAR